MEPHTYEVLISMLANAIWKCFSHLKFYMIATDKNTTI